MPPPTEPENFEKPYVLLCEGVGDQRFFKSLFEGRGIGDDFHIRVPFRDEGGVTNFGRELVSISVSESFLANVKAVLVVGDNDSDMQQSFAAVQNQIRQAAKFGVPDAERTLAQSKDDLPPIVILMIPLGTTGNLESLCLTAAYAKFGLEQHLDAYVANTPAQNWTIGKQAKMRMQTILASTNRRRPDAGFAGHWTSAEEFRVPVDHSCFDSLVKFLKDFPALVAAG